MFADKRAGPVSVFPAHHATAFSSRLILEQDILVPRDSVVRGRQPLAEHRQWAGDRRASSEALVSADSSRHGVHPQQGGAAIRSYGLFNLIAREIIAANALCVAALPRWRLLCSE